MRKALFFLLIFTLLNSCKKENKNNNNSPFTWVDTKSFIEHQIPIVDESVVKLELENFIKDDNKINISDIISGFSFLSLEDKNHKIGGIDKLLFNKEYIFVLDQNFSNSLYLYSRVNGKQLFAFDEHGQAPNQIGTIYDFDVDFSKKIVYIFDGENRKYMKFNFQGNFISYKRLPFRIDNVRRLSSGDFINFPKHSPNDHLGDFYARKNIIIADSLLTPIFGAFDYDQEVVINDFYNRDYFSYNNDILSFFPRYKNDIYLLEKSENYKFRQLLKVDLGKYQLEEKDFIKETEKFLKERRDDGYPFGNGSHFVSKKWVGASLKRFDTGDLDVFYNRENEQIFAGTSYNFDFKGLPFFAFPIDVNEEECVSIIDTQTIAAFKYLTDKQKQLYKDEGLWSDELENFMNNVEDIESPGLIFYTLK